MSNSSIRAAKRSSTTFLRFVIVLVGIAALAIMLWGPHFEGRNARATVFEVYFKDPLLAYAYVASIPFFVALYHGFKVLGYAGHDKVFSQSAVQSMRTIKLCAIAMILFVGASFGFMIIADPEDRPAGIFMRLLVAFPSIVVATAAATFERILQRAVDMKSENDLTV